MTAYIPRRPWRRIPTLLGVTWLGVEQPHDEQRGAFIIATTLHGQRAQRPQPA